MERWTISIGSIVKLSIWNVGNRHWTKGGRAYCALGSEIGGGGGLKGCTCNKTSDNKSELSIRRIREVFHRGPFT